MTEKDDFKDYVDEQIQNDNQWFTGSQFEWAEKESIRRIYQHRKDFFYKIIEREISRKGNVTLLDYGCGDGYWSLVFSRLDSCQVTGIDYNALRIERAKATIKDADFILADLRDFKESLGKFDIVFCSQVIEHVEDDVKFLMDLKSFFKDDGLLILGTPNEGSLPHRVRNFIARPQTDHVHFYKEREIKSKIETAGFKIQDIYREVFYPGWDRLYYKLTSSDKGFNLLQLLAKAIPMWCSDYYFECKVKG